MSLQPADDNAHRKGARLIVRYRHRPHYGESVELLRRDASSSSVRLVVRLPDGSPLTLQDWMTRPEAELFPTVLQPALRLGCWRTFMTSCLTFSCPLIRARHVCLGWCMALSSSGFLYRLCVVSQLSAAEDR